MIQLINVHKKIKNSFISKGIDLVIPAHKMTVIIGRSGEGKSLLLKQIMGLVKPTSGSILIDNKDITTLSEKECAPIFSQLGYVFQFAALLDSLNTFENIGIKLLLDGMPREKVLAIVQEKLALVHLPQEVLWKYPSELSGGMRKRVGLARTLTTNPSIILYDEPTTGLDPITTRVIHELMHDMQVKLNVTSVVISHDVEIFKYADHVALLHEGKIQYSGTACDIWQTDNAHVHQFIHGLQNGPIQAEWQL
ncbi:MAG: ABC transporter ATP-binding protein [Candidatus Babeliales bacterium]